MSGTGDGKNCPLFQGLAREIDQHRDSGEKRRLRATSLIVYSLHQDTVSNARLGHGLAWLERNRDDSKRSWDAYSLNGSARPELSSWHFRSGAPTALGVLALTGTSEPQSRSSYYSRTGAQ
jgi:hypothetical protein